MHLKLVGRQWTEGSDYLWLVSYAILASSENVSRAPLSTLDTPLGSEFKVQSSKKPDFKTNQLMTFIWIVGKLEKKQAQGEN